MLMDDTIIYFILQAISENWFQGFWMDSGFWEAARDEEITLVEIERLKFCFISLDFIQKF